MNNGIIFELTNLCDFDLNMLKDLNQVEKYEYFLKTKENFQLFREELYTCRLQQLSEKMGVAKNTLHKFSCASEYEVGYAPSYKVCYIINVFIEDWYNQQSINHKPSYTEVKYIDKPDEEQINIMHDRYLEFYDDYFYPSEAQICKQEFYLQNSTLIRFRKNKEISKVIYNKLNEFLTELGY